MGLESVMRTFEKSRQQTILAVVAAGLASAVTSASATEGYFVYGYGARQTALAGAGIADSRDAMAVTHGDDDQRLFARESPPCLSPQPRKVVAAHRE